jgi:hypothetical protein
MGKLSNKQNVRLGGLIAVLSGREPYEYILSALVAEGFATATEGSYILTEKGMREKDRLATLAGLMVDKDYSGPLKRTEKHPSRSHRPTPPQSD